MNYDVSEVLTQGEIRLLKGLIESIKNDSLDQYFFTKKYIDFVIIKYNLSQEVIKSLENKQIINISIEETCVLCNSPIKYCVCDEHEYKKSYYYNINIDSFLEYFIKSVEYTYSVRKISVLNIRDEKLLTFEGENLSIKMHIYFNTLSKEFFTNRLPKDEIHISIMPLANSEENINIFEWDEMFFQESISTFKSKIKEIYINIVSKDFYVFDLGDDIEDTDVEFIRDIFSQYLTDRNFEYYTEVNRYKPEVSDYNIPTEKIKGVFIKDSQKILIVKPTPKEIYLGLFSNGIINSDNELHSLVRSFYKYIQKKVQNYRALKKQLQNTSNIEKLLLIIATIANALVYISSLFTKNPIFKNIADFFKSNIPLVLLVILNIVYCVVILFTLVLPIARIYIFNRFGWKYGLNKVQQ